MSHLRWRNIGPGNMSGRVASIDALDADWRVALVGSASGGVFLTRNGGITWQPIFDQGGAGSIGVVAFSQCNPDVIWIGTGEANNRNSVGWGDGVYRSTDGGKTFVNVGLRDTRQIADVAVHPSEENIAYVAAVGSLWGDSGSRGLFKTIDGGKTWIELRGGLPDGPDVGCTEVVLHPRDPQVVLCGMYQRRRSPHWMHSGGPLGGVFKSSDGGATWRKLTDGLPVGDTGMIDLDFCRAHPDVVVAQVEASDTLPDDLAIPGPGIYRSDDCGESWRYLLRTSVRPFYHGQVAIDPNDPERIYSVGREFKVSKDGGKTWQNRWWSGGGDDHDLWIAPQDGRIRYMATDQGAHLTIDDGESVVAFENLAIGQFYAVGVDMSEPYRVVGGLQDNALWITPSNSRDPRGVMNVHSSWLGEGDGFHAQIDPRDNRTAYLVNHCGFAARVDLVTREHRYITPTPETTTNFAAWFDPDFAETPTDYTIDPGEHWFFGERPGRPLLPPQFRAAWSTPLVLSPRDPDVVYYGGNHLFESRDRGATWRIVSPDLTTNDPTKRNPSKSGGLTREVTGGENHCTIVAIGPSSLDGDVIWVGTDDGRVQLTRDGGRNWSDVRPALQATPGAPRDGAWISRVEPSHHVAGRCFVTLDDHRRDDYRPYVFATDDFGVSWRDLSATLPADGSVYVVREDRENHDLLFAGTEFGAFASLDRGAHWSELARGLPTVAVHDLVVHPRDHDLVAGTHGRSLWIADDVGALQQCTSAVRDEELWLFRPRLATTWRTVDNGRKQPDFLFRGENPERGAYLHFWSKAASDDRATLRVESLDGSTGWSARVEVVAGINRVLWPLEFAPGEREREALRTLLAATTVRIAGSVPDENRRAALKSIEGELAAAKDERALNRVRRKLVVEFGGFAGGRPSFGEALDERTAPPGTYRVRLTVGDRELSTAIVVRDDPLAERGR
ncbi:MAG: hypothetical protein HZB39_08810 [Planctomycetes bacterium]|nr:hypothetical protein [Planctomycetota bacterium]